MKCRDLRQLRLHLMSFVHMMLLTEWSSVPLFEVDTHGANVFGFSKVDSQPISLCHWCALPEITVIHTPTILIRNRVRCESPLFSCNVRLRCNLHMHVLVMFGTRCHVVLRPRTTRDNSLIRRTNQHSKLVRSCTPAGHKIG